MHFATEYMKERRQAIMVGIPDCGTLKRFETKTSDVLSYHQDAFSESVNVDQPEYISHISEPYLKLQDVTKLSFPRNITSSENVTKSLSFVCEHMHGGFQVANVWGAMAALVEERLCMKVADRIGKYLQECITTERSRVSANDSLSSSWRDFVRYRTTERERFVWIDFYSSEVREHIKRETCATRWATLVLMWVRSSRMNNCSKASFISMKDKELQQQEMQLMQQEEEWSNLISVQFSELRRLTLQDIVSTIWEYQCKCKRSAVQIGSVYRGYLARRNLIAQFGHLPRKLWQLKKIHDEFRANLGRQIQIEIDSVLEEVDLTIFLEIELFLKSGTAIEECMVNMVGDNLFENEDLLLPVCQEIITSPQHSHDMINMEYTHTMPAPNNTPLEHIAATGILPTTLSHVYNSFRSRNRRRHLLRNCLSWK